MKAKQSKFYEKGRDSKTGRFIPVAKARRRKATATVERVRRQP